MKPASPGPLTSLAIFVGLASAAIGSPDRHERIVNGADATVGQFPHQVSIRNTKYNKHKCGGAIIHSRWIVSAAFCTPDAYDLKYVAVVGSMELQGGGITYAILGVTNHPDFRPPNLQNDISLLHTAEPIRFGEVIQPIALPTVNTTANANAIISGWGSLKVSSMRMWGLWRSILYHFVELKRIFTDYFWVFRDISVSAAQSKCGRAKPSAISVHPNNRPR